MKITRKTVAIIVIILLAVTIPIIVINKRKDNKEVTTTPKLKKTKITEPVNIIDVKERPYLYITPSSDNHYISIKVADVKKEASNLDYELEYQSGSLLQGVFGSMDLNKLPATTKQLLGSCSAGGACTYHTDVTGGYITTRFQGNQAYALKSEWKYIENKEKETQLSSRDAKFQLSSDELSKVRLAIITNSPGYPEKLSGKLVSEVYALQTSTKLTGKGTLSIRTKETGDLAILGWNGQKWQEYKGKVEDKTVTAEVDLLELYLVVNN